MARKKLQRFDQSEKFANLAQAHQSDCKDRLDNFLKNKKPLTLELACGKGDYTLALARENPDKNYIGIDIQGERLWYGAKAALDENLDNVFFLRIQIENILEYLKKHSVDQIWITFPDPFPKKGQIKKRLTNPSFLRMYKKLLIPNGRMHLKTDDKNLFDYSQESVKEFGGHILEKIPDIYSQKHDNVLDIQTHYEKMHLKEGKTINYLKFSLN